MDKDMEDDVEVESSEVLCKAMMKAKKAFEDCIDCDFGEDAAYYELELTGYVLGSEFSRMSRIRMDERGSRTDNCSYSDKRVNGDENGG
jgi:hypothetical protein